jgi:hypothetical protein
MVGSGNPPATFSCFTLSICLRRPHRIAANRNGADLTIAIDNADRVKVTSHTFPVRVLYATFGGFAYDQCSSSPQRRQGISLVNSGKSIGHATLSS